MVGTEFASEVLTTDYPVFSFLFFFFPFFLYFFPFGCPFSSISRRVLSGSMRHEAWVAHRAFGKGWGEDYCMGIGGTAWHIGMAWRLAVGQYLSAYPGSFLFLCLTLSFSFSSGFGCGFGGNAGRACYLFPLALVSVVCVRRNSGMGGWGSLRVRWQSQSGNYGLGQDRTALGRRYWFSLFLCFRFLGLWVSYLPLGTEKADIEIGLHASGHTVMEASVYRMWPCRRRRHVFCTHAADGRLACG